MNPYAGRCVGLAAVIVGTILSPPPLASAQESVTVRIRPTGSDDQVLSTLQRYLAPKTITLEPGITPDDVIRSVCGIMTNEYVNEYFLPANPGIQLGDASGGTTIVVPPCPYWKDRWSVELPPSADLRQTAQYFMGTAGDDTAERIRRANRLPPDVPVWSGGKDYIERANTPLMLDYWVGTTSFELNEAFRDSDDVQSALRSIGDLPGTLEVALDANTTRPIGVLTDSTTTCVPGPADRWPYDRAALRDALDHNAREHAQAREPQRISVGVVDTGLHPPDQDSLPLLHSAEVFNPPNDLDGNTYFNDVFGASMLARYAPPWDSSADDYGHGTKVASLAGGGRTDDELRRMIEARIGLKILRVENGGIPHAALLTAFDYLSPPPLFMRVLNFSVGSRDPIPGLELRLAGPLPTVLVVAAGNDSLNLDLRGFYPASANPDGRLPMISVAAHGSLSGPLDEHARAPLLAASNYGDRVDLAAPGCAVPAYFDGAWRPQSGTSLAAPLVSFAAALVASEGIGAPQQVRRRILASVDIVPGLRVRTQGVLNVARAVLVHDDVIQTRSGQITFGRAQPVQIDGVDGPIPWNEVLKIARGAQDELLVLREGDTGVVQLEPASTNAQEIVLAGHGPIALSEIVDLTLRLPEHR